MSIPARDIPMHDFAPENDPGPLSLCYVPLEVHNGYDFSEPHRHGYYEIFYFSKGGGTHLLDFVAYEVADNSVHIVSPGQVHLLQRAPESYGAVIHFSREVSARLDKTTYGLLQHSGSILSFEAQPFRTIHTMLQLLQDELSTAASSPEVSLAVLNLLLLKTVFAGAGTSERSDVSGHFIAFRQLAEEHYRNGKQPVWYAMQLHITEKRLNEACKEATGNTVSHYLKERILLEAKRLLSHSAGSIKEIGYYLGFEDPAYFTRFFRKNAGITAGAFRNKYK